MTEETKQWWVSAVQSLGMPTVFLGIVLLMIWKAGSYISAEVVMPLFQRQVVFIDTATETLKETQIASHAVQQGQLQGFTGLKQIADTTGQTAIDVKRMIELLKEIEFVVKSNADARAKAAAKAEAAAAEGAK